MSYLDLQGDSVFGMLGNALSQDEAQAGSSNANTEHADAGKIANCTTVFL